MHTVYVRLLRLNLLSQRQHPIFQKRHLLTSFLLFVLTAGFAQPPTSLRYPANSAYLAQTSSVYLAPTFSGSTTGLSFSISPVLPSGLSFNTGTGVISGVPTAAKNATTYTVTATNGAGSASATFVLTVTTTIFDNANNPVVFLDANRIFKTGNGQAAGNIALYTNVATISGQVLDCIVTTVSATGVSTWDAYDQPLPTGTYFNSNNDKFFSPQLNFGAAGNVIFDFQFILGGSYNNATNTGTNVTLQNVLLNSYDIDGNGGAGSNQYNEIGGFSKSELGSGTTLNAPSYDATLGLTKYASGTTANNAAVTADATRVRLTYNNMSHFRLQVGAGAGGLAYFFFDFSAGPAFTTAQLTTAPSVDLNTTWMGTANSALGCASALPFSASGQTNVAAGTPLNELRITYQNTAANLPDGASELLLIKGATAGTTTHALNFGTGSTSSVTVGGVAFTITKTVAGTTNTIAFTNGSTFTVAQAEALADALQYSNSAAFPTGGNRNFTVNVRNAQFMSPDADFTASLNCVSVTGNVYHDANGLTDNTVNGNGTMGQFGAGDVYVVLTNPATNAVLATVPVAAGGAYTFGRQDPGTYNIYLSSTATPGATLTASTLPAGYKSVGENLGAGAGNDGVVDSKLTVSLGTLAASNANFGIQIPPAAADFTAGNQRNPGGFNYYSIPAALFATSDADGTIQDVLLPSFPSGANYLKVGSTHYTNGGTCPPQSTCTAWPGSLVIPYASIGTLAVDPSSAGNTSVSLQYKVVDNGSLQSNNGTLTTLSIPFVVPPTPISIGGTVWNDANGDGVKGVTENYTAAASPGQTLYVLLVQITNTYSGAPTILAATPVSAFTGYSFGTVPGGNNYEVLVASLATAPVAGAALTTVTPSLAAGYTGVSTNNNGTIIPNQNTNNLVIMLGEVSASLSNVGFGINALPKTAAIHTNISMPAVNSLLTLNGGSNPPVLAGSDAEDQPVTGPLSGRKVAITALPVQGQLWYNGVQVTKGADNITAPSPTNPFLIPAFDASLLQVKFAGLGYSSVSFSYAYIDAAGIEDPAPATYTLSWATVLPVQLENFTVQKEGAHALLTWQTANESSMKYYVVERSSDGAAFQPVAVVMAKEDAANSYRYADALPQTPAAKFYYRLKQVNVDGNYGFSPIVWLSLQAETTLQAVVSPNPAQGRVTLQVKSSEAATGRLTVHDLNGQSVLVQALRLQAGTTTLQLDAIQKLPAGTYLLKLDVNGRQATQRLVVQR